MILWRFLLHTFCLSLDLGGVMAFPFGAIKRRPRGGSVSGRIGPQNDWTKTGHLAIRAESQSNYNLPHS